jgi:hypothetical protein
MYASLERPSNRTGEKKFFAEILGQASAAGRRHSGTRCGAIDGGTDRRHGASDDCGGG